MRESAGPDDPTRDFGGVGEAAPVQPASPACRVAPVTRDAAPEARRMSTTVSIK